jgi:hypothetical protein
MAEQIVVLADERLQLLYHNYHERLFAKLGAKLKDRISLEALRSKPPHRLNLLDCFFEADVTTLDTEPESVATLQQMAEAVAANIRKCEGLAGLSSLPNTLQVLKSHTEKFRRTNERKSTKQIQLEKNRSSLASIQLMVSAADAGLEPDHLGSA